MHLPLCCGFVIVWTANQTGTFLNFKDFIFPPHIFFFFNLILNLNVSTDLFYVIFGWSQKQIVLKNIMRVPLLLKFLAQYRRLQRFGLIR